MSDIFSHMSEKCSVATCPPFFLKCPPYIADIWEKMANLFMTSDICIWEFDGF
jgi:hypothetical protein